MDIQDELLKEKFESLTRQAMCFREFNNLYESFSEVCIFEETHKTMLAMFFMTGHETGINYTLDKLRHASNQS